MKVRLLGLGAVGAPIAVRLSACCDFAILLTPDRYERYSAEGCTVNGRRYDFPVAEAGEDDVDLIIVACKNNDLSSALDLIGSHTGHDTVLMSLLNGIDSERVLGERFGSEHVIYSFITNLSSVRQGRSIDCFSPRGGLILFNEKDGQPSSRVKRIASLFDRAGIWYEVSDSIIHDIWWKFGFNICINSLSAIMGLDYSQMNGNEAFYRLVRMLWREIRTVAAAEGVCLSADDEQQCLSVIAAMAGPGKTSMLQDVEAGRATENRYFAGCLSSLGKKHSIPTPLSDFLFTEVEAKEHAAEYE